MVESIGEARKSPKNVCNDSSHARAEILRVARLIQEGNLDARVDLARFTASGWLPEMEGLNQSIDALVQGLGAAAAYVEGLATGIIPPRNTVATCGRYETVRQHINVVTDQVNMRGQDIQALINAVKEGYLDFRADIDKYGGSYSGKQVAGINLMLDSLVTPLKLMASYMDQIAQGKVPPRIDQRYEGDFERIRTSINTCIESVNALTADSLSHRSGGAQR